MTKNELINKIESDSKIHNIYNEMRYIIGEEAYDSAYMFYTSDDEDSDKFYWAEQFDYMIAGMRDGIIEEKYGSILTPVEIDLMVELIVDELFATIIDDAIENEKD